jgi:hypothetical protein
VSLYGGQPAVALKNVSIDNLNCDTGPRPPRSCTADVLFAALPAAFVNLPLTASVTYNQQRSDEQLVATVVPTAVVSASAAPLATGSRSMLVRGSGFSPTPADNVLTYLAPAPGVVVGVCIGTNAEGTELTVRLDQTPR